MRSTRTSRNRVPDTPKWISTKKLLAAMSESMDTARVGVRRTNYEFRCGGAIGIPVGGGRAGPAADSYKTDALWLRADPTAVLPHPCPRVGRHAPGCWFPRS